MAYPNSALRRLKDAAVYQEATQAENENTAEVEDTWATVEASDQRCRYSDRTSRELPAHLADLEIKRLVVPGDLLINDNEPDKATHRVLTITRKSGRVLTGPFRIAEILDREDMKGNRKLITFLLERIK